MKITGIGMRDDLINLGKRLYTEISLEKTTMSVRPNHQYLGIEILIKEVGDEDNIIIVSIHDPSYKEKHQCHVQAYECEKTGNSILGCKTIEFEGKKYICSVTGLLPEENDLAVICSLSKALNIKTIIAFENYEIPEGNQYLNRILRKIA